MVKNRIYSFEGVPKKDLNFFEELFRLYYPRLKSYACKLLHNENEAEDLVQDVFFQLWQNGSQLDHEKNISSYVFTLLKNKCLNHLKHKAVEGKYLYDAAKLQSEELYHISFGVPGEFVSIEDKLISEIDPIISEMSDKCQTAFRLRWFEGKKIREIAAIMNISTTMVDRYLAKGLEIIRRRISIMYRIF